METKTIEKIREMHKHFESLKKLMSEIEKDIDQYEEVRIYHEDEYNLQHCIRWGSIAAEEIIINETR